MKTILPTLAVSLGCLAIQACNSEADTSFESAEHDAAKADLTGMWTCEEHWMVERIATDLAAMARLAGADAPEPKVKPDGNEHAFLADSTRLEMSPSCWDIASYAPLFKAWKIAAPNSPAAASDPVHELLKPTVKALQAANLRISSDLAKNPADPALHEQAAFLLGVLGVRENARDFSDLRPLLCRMTAHLAFARHLGGSAEPSPAGQLALVLFDLHAGRPKQALARMENGFDSGDAAQWKSTLTLLITGDWRQTKDPAKCSLAEAIAHARALHTHRGNDHFIEFLKTRNDLQELPEWTRILGDRGRSVQQGHILMKSGLSMEMAEIDAVFPIGNEPEPKKLGHSLSTESPNRFAGADESRVISKGDWAAYFRRHFFAAAADIARFAIVQWGEPKAAAQWEEAMLPFCRAMTGHELIEPLLSTRTGDFQKDLRATAAYIQQHPEQAPTALWFNYRYPFLRCSAETAMPDQVPWFRTVSPPGTAHDPLHRIRFSGIHGGAWAQSIKALHAIDPWNHELCYELAENSGNTVESVKQAWGSLHDYSVKPLKQSLATAGLSIEHRIEVLEKLSALDPEVSLDLGTVLVVRNRPEEAIKAFENAFENAADRVAVSNRSQWMIHYYKSRGNDAAAHKIADHNAEVYSSRGLQSAMTLALVERNKAQAVSLARKISDRYDDPCFSDAVAWVTENNAKATARLFPAGVQDVTVESLKTSKARSGQRLVNRSTIAHLNGLRVNDVILAVDGKRIETFDQYIAVICRKLDPNVKLIIRRGGKIEELECILPNRRLETDLETVP